MAELDKFYTSKDISKKCVDLLHTFLTVSATDIYLEPTAGNGAFLDYLTNYEAYDLKPEDDRTQFKNVEQDWEIAVYRQGYKDYSKKFTQADKDQVIAEMNGSSTGTKIQFFFIKPMTECAKCIINRIDFAELAHKNTSIPGFGKADFVEYYLRLKQELGS